MDSIIDFMKTNPEVFNSYLSIGLSILIIILLATYYIVWDGINGNLLFFAPLVLLGLCFFIYQSSVGTVRTVFGWLLVVLAILTVLSLFAFYFLAQYAKAFKN